MANIILRDWQFESVIDITMHADVARGNMHWRFYGNSEANWRMFSLLVADESVTEKTTVNCVITITHIQTIKVCRVASTTCKVILYMLEHEIF